MDYSNSTQLKDDFSFQKVAVADVETFLENLDIHKATGFDNISAKLLKAASSLISPPLTNLINQSLSIGEFPKSIKIAKVKPLFKKGSVKLFSNYRPISILPVISKHFESVANSQIVKFLEDNHMLHESQYGFRKNKSTAGALTQLTNQVLKAFNDSKSVLVFI